MKNLKGGIYLYINGLSDKLRILRIKKGLSQEQIANVLGVTKSVISAYECQLRNPTFDKLIKLAQLYNVSTDYLLGVKNNKKVELELNTEGLSRNELMIIQQIIDLMRSRSVED